MTKPSPKMDTNQTVADCEAAIRDIAYMAKTGKRPPKDAGVIVDDIEPESFEQLKKWMGL